MRPLIAITVLLCARAAFAVPAEGAPAGSATAESSLVESITVTATSNPRPMAETAGTVDLIGRAELEQALASDVREILTFSPGVTTAGNPTRFGIGGFVIRGIGGNRVATRIDGVPTAEEFSFGPLGAQRFSIDPELLESVEIVRSAGSPLYGSDALGGVVSLMTRDPADYLASGSPYLGGRLAWDGRDNEAAAAFHTAARLERWSVSLALDARSGEAMRNQGEDDSLGAGRTTPNPMERESLGLLGKAVFTPSERSTLRLAIERFDGRTETDVLSSRTLQNLGPVFGPGVTYTIDTQDFQANDSLERSRLSADLTWQTDLMVADSFAARLFASANENDQLVHERVVTRIGGGFLGPLRTSDLFRDGVFRHEQDIAGAELQARRTFETAAQTHLLTWGLSVEREQLDMLRDREDTNAVTGAPVVPSTLVPTKYFPQSTVDTFGIYFQDEIDLASGGVRLIPGLRFDRAELDADQDDPVFLAGNPGTPLPIDVSADAVSPKLGVVIAIGTSATLFGQYARGFRTPPYSSVNNGFSNLTSGYRTLPNPNLDPETSDKDEDDLDLTVVDQFATPESTVVDLVGSWNISARFKLQAGIFNLFDETSWDWGDVGGLVATSPVLDRYTSPGRSGSLALRMHW